MFVDGKFQTFDAQGPLDYAAAMDFSPPENVLPTPPQFVMPQMQQLGQDQGSRMDYASMGKGAGSLFDMLGGMDMFGGGESQPTGFNNTPTGFDLPSYAGAGDAGFSGAEVAPEVGTAGAGVTQGAGIMGPAAVLAPIGKMTADSVLGEERTDLSKPDNILLSALGGMGRDSIMDIGSGLPLGAEPFRIGKLTGNNALGGGMNIFGGFGLLG